MTPENISFPAGLRQRLKSFITERSGLYFKDHDLKNMDNVVRERMKAHNFDSALSYYNYLAVSGERDDELRELFNLLTISHTYFFRNEPQFKALREKILPEIIQKKIKQAGSEKPSLRIWSAGCSTGEEPYSIAMIVNDVIADLDAWSLQIIATDASTDALKNAREGIYNQHSMRSVDDEHKEKYFIKRRGAGPDAAYQIRDTVKEMVCFDYLNLMEENFPAGFDIIFCRNVFIYFGLETILKVVNRFSSSLADDGCLFIGYSESLQFISDKFRMDSYGDAIFYRKATGAPVFEAALPGAETKEVGRILEDISQAEFAAEEKKIKAETGVEAAKEIENLLVQVIKYIYAKQYNRALALIDEVLAIDKEALEPHYLAAEIFVNQRRFDMAAEKLKVVLKLNPLFAPAHYLFASIHAEGQNLEKAKESLKKALYLDKGFAVAHFNLANIYRNEGKADEAIRGYRNTLNVLAQFSSNDIIVYSGGFNAATLASVCKDNIERLKYGIEAER